MSENTKRGDFKMELQTASTINDVLSVYSLLNKENVDPGMFDDIARKLLSIETGEDTAMIFFQMAEKRRSDHILSARIGQSIETALRAVK